MHKSTIVVIVLAVCLGFFVGIHYFHIRTYQAGRELCSRTNKIPIVEIGQLCKKLRTRSRHAFDLTEPLSDCDDAIDHFLEYAWFREPNSLKAASGAELYVESTFNEHYNGQRDYFMHAVYKGHYREARDVAKIACGLRYSGKLHNTWREANFADNLISAGMYCEAEQVLRDLLPVTETIGERDAVKSYKIYRQYLLAEALLGQQRFQDAADVLKPSEGPIDSDADYAEDYRAIAILELHRDAEALEIFKRHPGSFTDFFAKLCTTRQLNRLTEDQILNETIRFSKELEGASDEIPNLEFAIHALRSKGFPKTAARLVTRVQSLLAAPSPVTSSLAF
ncbi:MAG TPA: hypothetical protein V6C86_23460 [Oculatellaceae cyanobacterium]